MKGHALVYLTVMATAILTVALKAHAQGPAATSNAVVTVSPPPVEAPLRVLHTTDNSDETIVSMTFDETPLSDVVKAFRDATGANIISSGTNLQTIAVSIRLDNVPWRKGLTSILDPQGYQLIEQPAGSGIYVVTAKTVEIPRFTRTFDLDFAKASDVTNLLGKTFGPACTTAAFAPANMVIVTATEKELGECEKIIKAIDKPRTQVYIEARFVQMSASASKKLGLKWDSLGTDTGWGMSFDGASLGFSTAKGKSKTLGHDTSRGSTSSSETTLSDTFEDDVRSIAGGTTLADTLSSSSTRTLDNSTTRTYDRTFTGALSMDAFSLTMNAFEQLDGVSVFSNPRIIIANEETALVDMTTKEPNVSVKSSRSGTAGDQLDVTAELAVIPGEKEPFVKEAFYSYGITLKVLPRVSPSGQITVEIEPSISDKIGSYTIAGVSADTPIASYPIIDMRRIQTIFTMQSGTTAVIGGLTQTKENSIDSGIPLLRNIPWIGPRIFGWKSREKGQEEIIIFVTVGIVDPVTIPQDAGMPKNTVLSRGLIDGTLKEPGERTKEELLNLEDPKPAKKAKQQADDGDAEVVQLDEAPASEPVSEREAAQQPAEQPTPVEPLLKN